MSIISKIVEWANSGPLDDPGTAKTNDGYVASEQPTNENHNFIWNFRDRKMNELVRETAIRGLTPPNMDRDLSCAGFNSKSLDWANPESALNTLTYATDSLIHLARGWDYARNKPVVYVLLEDDDSKISVIYEDDDYTIKSEDWGIVPGIALMKPEAIACDGPTVFILFGNASGEAVLQSYNAQTRSSLPIATLVTSLSIGTGGKGRQSLIVADDTRLAFVAVLESTAGGDSIAVVDKSLAGGTLQTGIGNAESAATTFPRPTLTTDGEALFFVTYDSVSAEYYLCVADIDDLSSATGAGGSLVRDEIIGGEPGELVNTGRLTLVPLDTGAVSAYDKDDTDTFPPQLDGVMDTIGDVDISTGDLVRSAFDGLYVWFLYLNDESAPPNDQGVLVAFSAAEMSLRSKSTSWAKEKARIITSRGSNPTKRESRLVVSDGALWLIPDTTATSDAKIQRVPNLKTRI